MSTGRDSSMSPSSYRNMIFNQTVHVFSNVLYCDLVVSVSKRMLLTAAVAMKRTNQRVPFLGSIKKIPNQEKS